MPGRKMRDLNIILIVIFQNRLLLNLARFLEELSVTQVKYVVQVF